MNIRKLNEQLDKLLNEGTVFDYEPDANDIMADEPVDSDMFSPYVPHEHIFINKWLAEQTESDWSVDGLKKAAQYDIEDIRFVERSHNTNSYECNPEWTILSNGKYVDSIWFEDYTSDYEYTKKWFDEYVDKYPREDADLIIRVIGYSEDEYYETQEDADILEEFKIAHYKPRK